MILIDGNCCPEFDRWLQLRNSSLAIDFRLIQKVGFDLQCLGDYIVNLSAFEERSIVGAFDKIPNHISHRVDDAFLIVMKSIPLLECIKESQIENQIEHLINLRHPCIVGPIGFVFPIESSSPQELKIVRLYLEGCSLAEALSVNPVWWTSTVKAKVVAAIVLGLRFAHSFGLLHGRLTSSNILFDSDHCIQIVDFTPVLLEVGESEGEEGTQLGGFSGEGWTMKKDIQAFASILFEIVVGRPVKGETSVPSHLPAFVSRLIETGLWLKSEIEWSFHDIFEILKKNNFQIEDDVDSAEVWTFVSWVESTEQP
jgi:hypothetical protein